jgi:hypothetical protein
MKKLTNVSPFLLLLFPVFIMMILAISINTSSTDKEETVVKTTTSPVTKIVKVSAAILN